MSDLMTIKLRIKARGGIYLYYPYLRLKEIDQKDVESVKITDPKTTDKEFEVKYMDKEKFIIDCSDLILNLPKPAGSRYFNVVKTETKLRYMQTVLNRHFINIPSIIRIYCRYMNPMEMKKTTTITLVKNA